MVKVQLGVQKLQRWPLGKNDMQAETWKGRTEVDQGKKNPGTGIGKCDRPAAERVWG